MSTWFFPARMVNSVVLWAIVNGIVGLILFYITRDKSTYAHSNYRFLVVASRPLTLRWFLVALIYVPAMFIFYLANSIRAGVGTCYSDTPKWQTYLIAALANSVGLAMIFVIQYSVFAATGTVYWTDNWLYVNMLQSILNKMFYTNTGRVWLAHYVVSSSTSGRRRFIACPPDWAGYVYFRSLRLKGQWN